MSDDALQGQQDVNTAASSSTAATSDVNSTTQAPSQSASPDVNNQSATSSDTGVKKEESKSLKDAISDGLKKLVGKDSAKATPAEGEQDPAKQDATAKKTEGAEGDEMSDEEKKAPPEINNHPAFKKVQQERKQARAELKQALAQVETFKGDASKYQTLQTFLSTNQVPQAEAAKALKLTALAVKDPQAFYKELKALTDEWGSHLGYILPADLQKEVDEGTISAERAAELAKIRGQVSVAETQVQQVNERDQAQAQRAEFDHRVRLYEAWAGQTVQTDPELQKKLPMITERMKYILDTEGNPKNDKEAWDRLTRAHKDVTDRLKTFTPPKNPTNPAPRSTGTVQGAVSQPTNYDEAMQAAFTKLRQQRA